MTTKLKGLSKIVSSKTKILILGSFPGAESLEKKQYYANKRNQFWKILGISSESYSQKKKSLSKKRIGLWDVIGSCTREGSSDNNIRDLKVNDLRKLFKKYPRIETVILNGKKAGVLFEKLHLDIYREVLPSTSPANAKITFNKKRSAWTKTLNSAQRRTLK